MKFLKYLRHLQKFYVAASLALLVWLLFFDLNNIPTQIENAIYINKLENDRSFYNERIKILEKEQNEVLGSGKLLEKHAREKYFMRKDSEDVYVIVNEKGLPLEK